MSKKQKIIELIKDPEGYSAQEIADLVDRGVVYVRSVASRAQLPLPKLIDRVYSLVEERNILEKRLAEYEEQDD